MKKLSIIKTNQDWLEATWSDEEEVIHCESFSGHKEHIGMLKAKCVEFGTELTEEDEVIIKEISEAYVYPTAEEIAEQELNKKFAEADAYLKSTAWYVERLNDPSSGKEIPQEVLEKRSEAREVLNLKGATA